MASVQQKAWLEEYLQCFNATEAARRVGYKNPRVSGHSNKQKFADEIAERLREKHMDAEEVLALQADVAHGTMADFISFTEEPYPAFTLDLGKARRRGVLHLIKKLKYNSDGLPEIELYDAADARKTIMQHLGLLKQTVEIDWRKEAEEHGIDAGELFEHLVKRIAAIETGNRPDDGGSVERGEA